MAAKGLQADEALVVYVFDEVADLVREPSSSRAISRCRSSRPETPGVSINRLNSASLSVMSYSFLVLVNPMSVPAAPETVKIPYTS
jgi:hypothetical protein